MSWNLDSLYETLAAQPHYQITRFDNALLIIQKEYGDLPLTLTLTRKEMLAEICICPVNTIGRKEEFNLFLLRHQKSLPLSTVGISTIEQQEFYIAFGALAINSSLDNIILEIETLTENAIELADLVEEFI